MYFMATVNVHTYSIRQLRFQSCCWIRTLVYHASGDWELRVKGTLIVRRDTGAVNHSPISSTSPIVRLQYGCSHTIRIPGNLFC